MNKATIDGVCIVIERDDDGDVSYLDGSNHLPHNPANWSHVSDEDVLKAAYKANLPSPSGVPRANLIEALDKYYAEQDKHRLAGYKRGDWAFLGISAKATVSYEIDPQGHRRLESFSSGGLWGIESDSGEEYFAEVKREQLNELKAHLEQFNVDCSNWDELMEAVTVVHK